MRVLKFRAWDGNQMVHSVDLSQPRSCYAWLGLIDCPLMQYVGHKDSKDVEVYEGDIVLLPADQLCYIKYEDTGFIAIAINPPDGYPKGYDYWHAKEVVGNIYENKELL